MTVQNAFDDLRTAGDPARNDSLQKLARFGIATRGVVFAILAWFMARVALNADSSEWRGSAGALREIARQPHGMVLLGLVAAGLAMYGAYQIVAARHWKVATR